MKKITNSLTNIQNNKIASSLQYTIENLLSKPLITPNDVVERVITTQLESSELLLNQSILKSMFPRFSVKKAMYLDALQNNSVSSDIQKLFVENGKIPGDIRHVSELIVARRYSNTSDLIKKVTLRDESDGNPISKEVFISTSNKNPDLYIVFDNGSANYRDIKAGNINDKSIFAGNLQEIPYVTETQLYEQALNTSLSLGNITELRMQYFKGLVRNRNDFSNFIIYIEELDTIRETSEIKYNLLVQDEMYKNINLHATYKINFSYYYGRIINECHVNPDFYAKIQPHITPDIFSDKQKAGMFIARALITYHETVSPIIKNIQQTKGTTFDLDKWLCILKELDDKQLF